MSPILMDNTQTLESLEVYLVVESIIYHGNGTIHFSALSNLRYSFFIKSFHSRIRHNTYFVALNLFASRKKLPIDQFVAMPCPFTYYEWLPANFSICQG